MTTCYCPACWKVLPGDLTVCPFCQTNIERFRNTLSYEEKLIHALHHPEPTTVTRAAWILGEKRVAASVLPLVRIARESPDIYVVLEVTRALGKIGTPECQEALRRLTRHPARMVRQEAEEILDRVTYGDSRR